MTSTDKQELPKTFDPSAIEAKWYPHWEGTGAFRPERPGAEPYTIVNPPPNVTGSLHIGHALDNTLQDVMIRYERLRGKDALWVVGTDHAGIATQMVVERQLEARQDKRTNYSREDFVKKVWEWKEESGGQITRQLRRLGCSMDWSREQFTMDPHFSKAVLKVFVDLYNQGLIYRDKRLVNWDPKLKTAISDLEVETREVQGHFWHFKYPLADGVRLDDGRDHIVVATTRPETMLADMAVAVNAADPRYQSVIGKFVELPITGRRIPIVADDHADPKLGSGAVKITPGHDFNDFEVGRRAGIAAADMLNMFDAEARVVQVRYDDIPEDLFGIKNHSENSVNAKYGVDRFEARKIVVQLMKEKELLVPFIDKDGNEHDAEPRTIQTPYGDRGGVVIEPWLTDQWYVDALALTRGPRRLVERGAIEIVPKSWEKTFFHWMDNIQPWCVSRQLWWGHRIPVWYGPRKEGDELYANFRPFIETGSKRVCFVAETSAEALAKAREYYGSGFTVFEAEDTDSSEFDELFATEEGEPKAVQLKRDPDVLDTWFSSALWPFATLGWPDDETEKSSPSLSRGGGSASALTEGQNAPTAIAPPPPAAVPLPETSSGRIDLLQKHYPNDLLISGFDILFFWDARMAMMGTHFMGQAPWKRLYLHGLVRAADGAKMSKSKGNTVDPLGLIDQYGADALRFFMAAMESQGRDIKMDEKRVEGYRNFATKLWNAARFCQANGIGASASVAAPAATLAVNRWIIGEVAETVAALDKALADLRFDAAANAIYHFVWDQFCDWYLELIKPELQADQAETVESPTPDQAEPVEAPHNAPAARTLRQAQGERAEETRRVAGWVLDQILVMLHPFMPFITEELWHALGERSCDLIVAQWPQPGGKVDAEAKAEIETLVEFIQNVRSLRNEYNVPPSAVVAFIEVGAGVETSKFLDYNKVIIQKMCRTRRVGFSGGIEDDEGNYIPTDQDFVDEGIIKGQGVQFSSRGIMYSLLLKEHIDIAAEKARLAKALEAVSKEAKSLEGRLSNPAFVEKAKPEAVEKARADHAEKSAEAERLAAALKRLG